MSFSFETLLFASIAAIFAAGIIMHFRRINRQKGKGRKTIPPPYGKVHFDEEKIVLLRECGEEVSIYWEEVAKLRILTTPDGPFAPDLFWVFDTCEGTGMKIPSEADGMSELSDRLMNLSGFRSEEMIVAMSSTEYASFEIWKRTPASPSF